LLKRIPDGKGLAKIVTKTEGGRNLGNALYFTPEVNLGAWG